MIKDVVDFSVISKTDRYKLLVASITPRPIALVTTLDLSGRINAAPFSFFNAICDDPPMVAIGINSVRDGVIKDTASNITHTGEFVVNLVDEAMGVPMNECARELPPGENELVHAGLTAEPALKVAPPRIAESPISLECRRHSTIQVGTARSIVLGEVLAMSFRKGLHDPERHYVDAKAAGLIGRMHGAGWYARMTDLVHIARSKP